YTTLSRTRAVDRERGRRLAQGIAVGRRIEGQGDGIHPGLIGEGLVVEQGDRVPDLGDAPQAAVARVQIDHGLLPLGGAVGDDIVDVQQVIGVLVQVVVGAVIPVHLSRVSAVHIQYLASRIEDTRD